MKKIIGVFMISLLFQSCAGLLSIQDPAPEPEYRLEYRPVYCYCKAGNCPYKGKIKEWKLVWVVVDK